MLWSYPGGKSNRLSMKMSQCVGHFISINLSVAWNPDELYKRDIIHSENPLVVNEQDDFRRTVKDGMQTGKDRVAV